MAYNNVKFKRSAVAGKIPQTTDLELGQLALNTHDGRIYLKKSVSSVESIVTIQAFPEGGDSGQVLVTDGAGNLSWANNGGAGALTVSEIDGTNTPVNEVGSVTAIRFDNTTGFAVTDLGGGEVKVSLGSSFKTWQVAGQSDLVAVGEDTIEIIAGNGIELTTNTSSSPKSLTITATGGGTGGLDQTLEYFTGDGSTVNFTLANTVTDPDYAVVSLNGVELQYGVDFTFTTEGTVLRFEEADATENPPAEDAVISVRIFAPGGGGGATAIDDLTDVDTTTTAPTLGQALVWDGTNWVPGDASTVGSIDDLSDVDTTTASPTVGQALVWDGANWIPGDAGTSAGAPVVSNFTGDGTTTSFDLGHVIASESVVLVFVNSVYQDTDVYSVSGTEVTFTEAPLVDDRVNIVLLTTTISSGSSVSAIDDLTDVDTTTDSPVIGQTLVWDGTNWIPGDAIPDSLTTEQQTTIRSRIGAASVEDAIMLSIVMA
jgi:hypothetical protein